VRRRDASKLVTDESENEVLPDAIGDALSEAEDPLSAGEVEGVFPYGATDALVEEEVVRRREEGRGWMEVSPEGPEGLDGRKGRDLLDTFFIVRDLVSWRTLLAEPEDPSVFRGGAGQSSRRRTRWFSMYPLEGRGTYVRATEGVNGQCGEPRG